MAGNVNLGMTIPFVLGYERENYGIICRIWFAAIPLTKSGLPDYKRKNEKTSVGTLQNC